MTRQAHRLSIFSWSLDRAAFVAYLLGAVVPLLALAVVLERQVLPALPDGAPRFGLIGLVLSIAMLSAGSFLALRRVTWRTVTTMHRDNERLAALLDAAGRLAEVPDPAAAGATAVAAALRMADARAAALLAPIDGEPPKLLSAAGESGCFDRFGAPLAALVGQAARDQRPGLLGGPGGHATVAAVPMPGVGVLAVAAGDRHALISADVGALETLGTLASVAGRRAQLAQAQRNFFVHVTDLLVAALDAHLDVQSGHSRRVAELANRLGRALALEEASRQRLHFAALLHDVGMLRIPPARFGDPKAYRQHPGLGHRMLAPIQLWSEIAPMVLHHHEWFDGQGYPDGLIGEAIPLEARIIGLCEAFDSMTSASSYKPTLERAEAVRRIEAGSGAQFDPRVVAAFQSLLTSGEL